MFNPKWPSIAPPVAEKKEHYRTIHGDTTRDDYYWMIDYFKKGPESEQVVQYLESENRYLDDIMADTRQLQANLFTEMKARIKEQDESVPYLLRGYYYYTRTETGRQYYKSCRKKGSLDAPEEILLDIDELAADHSYYALSGLELSEDNRLLAYGVDVVSRRQYTIYIKNLETGETYSDAIANTQGDPTWASDNQNLFYTANNPETLLSEKICRHTLGTESSEDKTVYQEADRSNYIGVGKSKDNKIISIVSRATLSSEVRFINADAPDAEFRVFQPRMQDMLYSITHLPDRFLIRTNWNALNFRLMECPPDRTGRENWTDVVPHREDVLLQGLQEFRDFIVLNERFNGLTRLQICALHDGTEHYLAFGEPAYAAGFGTNPEYNTNLLRFSYTSLTTPASVYDYDMTAKTRTLLKQAEVVGGYDPDAYTTERLSATGADGTLIPLSIVYKNGFKKNGAHPLLLYAYGSYGHSVDAAFNSSRLSLLDRGFAFAIAHIRGGQDLGRYWYEDGRMMNKKNTFSDFIDCARFLIQEKYTSPQHLYAQGGSAGGLLMGAIINLAPELWHGVIAQVPFVDVVNTMLDESIPLTTNEFGEWGNPKNEDAYHYLKSYSPYENVEPKEYPNLLVTTGLHDSQVQYFEPAKWIAKLRDTKTGNSILLLHTNMTFGHGGASGRFDYLKDVALNYAFLFKLEGISQ